MTQPPRKLISATFLNRLSRLTSDSEIIIAISGISGHDQQYEEIPGAVPGMYSINCGHNWDQILRTQIDVRTIAYQSSTSIIFCYVAHDSLAYSWASRHRIKVLDDIGIVEVSELTDEGRAVQAHHEKYIELSDQDRSPSLLAERIRPLMSTFETSEL